MLHKNQWYEDNRKSIDMKGILDYVHDSRSVCNGANSVDSSEVAETVAHGCQDYQE